MCSLMQCALFLCMVPTWMNGLCFWAKTNSNVVYCTQLYSYPTAVGILYCLALLGSSSHPQHLSNAVFSIQLFLFNYSVHTVPLQCVEPTLNVGGWAIWVRECVFVCVFIFTYTFLYMGNILIYFCQASEIDHVWSLKHFLWDDNSLQRLWNNHKPPLI